MSVAEDVNNVYVLTKGRISGQIIVGRDLLGSFEIMHACEEPPEGPAVVIGRHLAGDLSFGHLATPEDLNNTLWLQVGDIAAEGSVEVTGSIGETGLLKITGDPNAPVTVNGSVIVHRDLSGDLEIVGTVAEDGVVEVTGAITGYPSTAGHMQLSELSGTVHVGGYIGAGGGVEVNGPTSGTIDVDSHLHGYLHLQKLSGLVDVAGYMGDPNAPAASFPGHVRLYGGLVGTAKIWVHTVYPSGGPMGPKSYVTVDYDGFTQGDDWSATASVVFGNNDYVYHGNTPNDHVWHTSRCHGDADNSRNNRIDPYYPDFTDINPFILALSSPVQFSLAYPGLADTDGTVFTGGGILYKGDCNCDGTFDFADINPFVALLTGTCDPNCPDCEGGDAPRGGGDAPMGGDEPLSPEEMAAQLAENVWPELYDNLLFVVAGAIDAAPDDETQAYWQAVYAALTE